VALRDSVTELVDPEFDFVFVHQDVASHEQWSTGVVYESVDATQSPLHDELRDVELDDELSIWLDECLWLS